MSELMQVRDWTTLPLEPGGRSLIEASAGTGKTWTISALYLRLLLDATQESNAPLTPRGIVVATFTDAAADELRERIRGRLLRAEQIARALPDLALVADAAEAWLAARWRDDAAQRERDRTQLRLALGQLDLAPIGTLHGLCARVLRDYPFESGGAFVPSELIAGDELTDELADDLWRQLQQGVLPAPPFDSIMTRAKLREQLKWCLMPGVGLWAPTAQQFEAALDVAWVPHLIAIAEDKSLWKGKGAQVMPASLRAFAASLRDRNLALTDKQLGELGGVIDRLEGSKYADEREFLAANTRLLQYAAAAPEIRAWQHWIAQVREWRETRLDVSDRLTFDDLLTRARDALARAGGALAQRLFAQWPVALVDEFQDTDATQYAILDRIYRDEHAAPRGRLVMIGDPKQAIYRFRGGDIATYRRAKSAAQAQLKLMRNFRSMPAYVAALNEWFSRAGARLSAGDAAETIEVDAVEAGRSDAVQNGAVAALVIHYRADAPEKSADRISAALLACAEQIVALLNAEHADTGKDCVTPGDIAVLLPTHRQVQELRALLTARRVPCVGAGKGSVFGTDSARELQIVLHAIEHGGEGARRAALATSLGGLDYAALVALRDAPERAEEYARKFAGLKQKWQREGVLAVVLELAQHAVLRIADMAERERALTDLRHLGELLEEHEQHLHGPEQLLAWMAAQRERRMDEADPSDERLLRIESDAKRVRLMTLHMSKGLEFPIVMLPLMWAHGPGKDDVIAIEEPLCGERVIGYGSLAQAQFAREGQDERFRVLYVALTRAQQACHLFAYSPRRLPRTNSKQPLGDPERSALDAMLDRLLAGAAAPTPPLQHIAWRTDAWSQNTRTPYRVPASDMPAQPVVLPLPPLPLHEDLWSFSALMRTRHARDEEAAADDEGDIAGRAEETDARTEGLVIAHEHEPDPNLLALSALRGTEFGNALHQMFETRRIGVAFAAQHDLIDRALREYGVSLREMSREVAIGRIATRLDAVLAAELASGLRLGALAARSLRAEMDFRFALDAVPLRRLREVCVAHREPELVPAQLPVQTLRGLMVGMIDLVIEHDGRFHVLDYKSNHLGEARADYAPAALPATMDTHHYRLQALLYTVALDRYLRTRVVDYRRECHLGDAIYLFVRAVGIAPDIEPALGIWRQRFDNALIAAVDRVLAGAREVV